MSVGGEGEVEGGRKRDGGGTTPPDHRVAEPLRVRRPSRDLLFESPPRTPRLSPCTHSDVLSIHRRSHRQLASCMHTPFSRTCAARAHSAESGTGAVDKLARAPHAFPS